MNSKRLKKVSSLLRNTLADLMLRNIKDPRITGVVTIEYVKVSRDLRTATVFISIFSASDKEKQKTVVGLQSSTPYLQYLLSKELRLRYIPVLQFKVAPSYEESYRVVEKINKLKVSSETTTTSTGNTDEHV